MTFAELLKSKGVSSELVSEISEAMKENKFFIASEENLDVRYGKLKKEHETSTTQLTEANELISTLKKGTKDNEGLQTKISDYETENTRLQKELEQTKKESAMKVALLGAGVKESDIDYLSFQIQKKGTELKLDDNGAIKGMDDILAGLKVQFPSQFETSSTKKVEEKKLDDPDTKHDGLTKSDFLKKSYQERLQFKQEHPDEFTAMMNS